MSSTSSLSSRPPLMSGLVAIPCLYSTKGVKEWVVKSHMHRLRVDRMLTSWWGDG